MKVLYLRTRYAFNLTAGGSVTHTSGVINALSKNHEVTVATNDHLPEVSIPTSTIRPIKFRLFPTAINEILYNLRVIRKFKSSFDFDFVYHRLSANSFCGAYLAKKNTTNFILEYNASEAWGLKHWNKIIKWTSIRGLFLNIYKYIFEIPVATLIEKYNLKVATTIIVVSNELKRILVDSGVHEDKIVVYPNGVDTNKFNPNLSKATIRIKYNFSDQQIVAGFIGSFGQWHGVEIFAKSINHFFDKNPNDNTYRFLLIGDGLKMSIVKKLLDSHITSKRVVLTGLVPQANAPEYLAACDVLVSPHIPNPDGTKFFGSPTKLFEYMAMGKLIVASDLDQIGEILTHMQNALLVTPGNPSALSETFDKICSNWESLDYAQLKTNARIEACKLYTWDCHVKELLKHNKNTKF